MSSVTTISELESVAFSKSVAKLFLKKLSLVFSVIDLGLDGVATSSRLFLFSFSSILNLVSSFIDLSFSVKSALLTIGNEKVFIILGFSSL